MQTVKITTEIKKHAIIGGSVNAITSGLLNWLSVRDKESVLISDDLISSTKETFFLGAVPAAIFLAFIITSMTYFKFKHANKPAYFPKIFWLALKHTIFASGIVILTAILIQRFLGSLTVTPIQSVLVSAIVSGLVGGMVDYMTKKELFGYRANLKVVQLSEKMQ